MATNLLQLLSSAVTPDHVQGLARFLGEKDTAVQSGVGAVLPVLLGGMASKATTPSSATNLFSMLTGPKVDPGLLGNFSKLLGSGQSGSLLQTGGSQLSGLFGADKATGLASALSGMTGMKTGSAGNFVALMLPLVFGLLKKFIGDNGLDARRLASQLTGQKEFLAGKLDPRLTSALGLGTPTSLLGSLGPATEREPVRMASTSAGAAATAASTSGTRRWLPWLIAAAIAAVLLSQVSRFGPEPTVAPTATAPAPTTTTPPATTTAPPTATTPPATQTTPPATATAGSLPAKVYFETGKAEITADGRAKIKEVAGMLASNASAKVDVTGYTDKTGDSAANETLAKDRAMAVKNALQAEGVAPDRVGTKPPVFVELGAGGADAQARRVEIAPAQ